MLDVHPPEHAAHTWRDFLIHIATIIVGLLIAIGLEQTVELLHRRHQRHQVEDQLRAETLANMNAALQNIDAFTVFQAGIVIRFNELQTATREHRTPQPVRPPTGLSNLYPANAVWLVSQQGATLGLLPIAVSELYVDVYRNTDRVISSMMEEFSSRERLYAAELPGRTLDPASPQSIAAPISDFARMTPDQLRTLSERLADVYIAAGNCIVRNRQLYAIDWAAWHGYISDTDLQRISIDARTLTGGKAAMLARYPLPEEAKHLASAITDR